MKVKITQENTESSNEILSHWVEKYTDTLYSWAFYKTSDVQTAEDLVQETFLAACKNYESFQYKSKPKTWLFAILNNKIIDYYRKKSRDSVRLENSIHNNKEYSILEQTYDSKGYWKEDKKPVDWNLDEQETNLLDNTEFNGLLQHCLIKLPPLWSSAVKLKYLEGRGGTDIVQELDITSANYWQIIHRSKLFLRECLEKLWFQK
ncbi:RNA polymerase subunit sigma [Christiangramia fulva]|uniref:RNA polymerase subunit sigma n=1 Tax=Christiangramia fulva TaxID=2126553 RepID=A0A2R3Z476_9FLAO|nr:sigma-70 family RNA polymerase sigma factor [Christiangramia fulva]AVR45077.1 RNA polymerase subunit sigma [Christiangramia fulva]